MLLEKGAKIDVVGLDGRALPTTPLLCALELGAVHWPDDADTIDKYEEFLRKFRYEVVKLLVDHGCNVDLYGREDPTPLGTCAATGDVRVLKLLLEAGANVNGVMRHKSAEDEENWFDESDNPKAHIFSAIGSDKVETTIMLKQYGAGIFSEITVNNWTGKQDLLLFVTP